MAICDPCEGLLLPLRSSRVMQVWHGRAAAFAALRASRLTVAAVAAGHGARDGGNERMSDAHHHAMAIQWMQID